MKTTLLLDINVEAYEHIFYELIIRSVECCKNNNRIGNKVCLEQTTILIFEYRNATAHLQKYMANRRKLLNTRIQRQSVSLIFHLSYLTLL